jgi:hypothetical protein
MNSSPWKNQIVNGRVFELRSRSKRYPAPCALVIDEEAQGWNGRIFELVDEAGVVGDGLYSRSHNPNIYVGAIRRDQFNSSRVVRRRRDLERFDRDDLALIRYGYAIDFNGRIHGSSGGVRIPVINPASWTVFWTPAYRQSDYRYGVPSHESREFEKLISGAWWFHNHGGPQHLGYSFGDAWGTRHTGSRLRTVRDFLRSRMGNVIEQQVRVVRYLEGNAEITEELRRECPALGMSCRYIRAIDNGIVTGICA